MTSVEWDDSVCEEWVADDDGLGARRTPRAAKECEKRFQAFWKCRRPQDKLDEVIIELERATLSSPNASERASVPLLFYGLPCHFDDIQACAVRIGVKFKQTNDPDIDADLLMSAVERFFRSQCGVTVFMEVPFHDDPDFYIAAIDDSKTMRHKMYRNWDDHSKAVLRVLRKLLGFGDQPAQWWWSAFCDEGYTCPLLQYNPPQISDPIRKAREEKQKRALSRQSILTVSLD